MEINLAEMKPGQKGIIKHIQGGPGFSVKINQIGLRKGKEIKKISSVFKNGPVTLSVDNLQLAIGHGKATRIIVEVNNDEKNSSGRQS